PGNQETINGIFRAVHTLKGGSGLFPYESLTRVVHAAEDVLVTIRGQEVPLTRELIDLLLRCVDCVGSWLECIAQTGALPASAGSDGDRLAAGLRAFLPAESAARAGGRPGGQEAGPVGPPRAAVDLPTALRIAAEEHRRAGPVQAVRYTPDAQCFFSGEDPLLLVRQSPGLLALEI